MRYIYLITSPSGKHYVGQASIPVEDKIKTYRKMATCKTTTRKIVNAIRKHGWEKMIFEIIEQDNSWSKSKLNEREEFWIKFYNTIECGYNMTKGGDGVDSESARKIYKSRAPLSEERKRELSEIYSIAQQKRYRTATDSLSTKERKSQAHRGQYRIESPDGRVWVTDLGLKDFAKLHENELTVSYWQLFAAYRKCYTNTQTTATRKNINYWKVTRLDKSDI